VPFLKFSRDKRGYENYSLFDGKGRPRLLFWFRTPPQMKLGRAPFSDEVRARVEAQNPGVFFDWARIMATPIPSPDVEHWRERRRAEKAAKRAARESDGESEPEAVAETGAESGPVGVADEVTSAREDGDAVVAAVEAETPAAASDVQNVAPGHRRKRRRRRGRRGGGNPAGAPVTGAVTDVAEAAPAPLPEPPPSNDEV
jgi:hypothetical protein